MTPQEIKVTVRDIFAKGVKKGLTTEAVVIIFNETIEQFKTK